MARVAKIKTINKRLAALAVLVVAHCWVTSAVLPAASHQGTLEIQIKDHREAIGDFARLIVTIDKFSISPKPGIMFWRAGWKEFTPSTARVDLTQYTGDKTTRVFRGALDAGTFDAFNLIITDINAVLKKNARSTIVKNTLRPVKLSFEVPSEGETILILDLVVSDFSDHPPRGYELGIKGLELYTNGKLIEKIPPG